ncbi:arylsulfatase [Sunxiuqinia sp. A32]|uniref:arylsulfatase n=1 Tax=Sunxiuqinia sp. A32 TaxID=3461496 RepID=UPI004045A6DB
MKIIKATSIVFTSGMLFSACVGQVKQAEQPKEKPNILVILADDLGYSDLGCYGSEIQTPNIDALAQNGVRFTQFYNSARCCPSRATLLTGIYPHQAGIGSFVGPDRGVPGYAGRLTSNAVTLAEVLKENGYRTFGAGKWHVNKPGPTERGFEEFYGFLDDYGVDGWEPKWMQRFPEGRVEREYKEGEFFATNAITDYALDFLGLSESTPEKPWFLYLSYQAVHFPLQAPKKDIEKYKDTYQVGWDTIRAHRYERMKELGVVGSDIQLSERSDIPLPRIAKRNNVPGDGVHNPPWDILEEDRKADLARRMAVYAGMLDNMDQNIGRVISYLKEKGELDNTLILFMSDNGSCAEWDPFGFEYPNYDDRVAGGTPNHPNVLHTGESLERLGGPDGPLFSFGSAWANVGNTPFTLYKQFVHEGGISSPLIVHWPEKINESKIFTDNYAHFVDVMATCVDVSGGGYPEIYNGNEISPMEGISLFKTLNGEVDPERVLPFEHQGVPAIRKGDWKLVSRNRHSMGKLDFSDNPKFELYNIAKDRSETTDLADQYPEKVSELKELMLSEFNRIHVFPKP